MEACSMVLDHPPILFSFKKFPSSCKSRCIQDVTWDEWKQTDRLYFIYSRATYVFFNNKD